MFRVGIWLLRGPSSDWSGFSEKSRIFFSMKKLCIFIINEYQIFSFFNIKVKIDIRNRHIGYYIIDFFSISCSGQISDGWKSFYWLGSGIGLTFDRKVFASPSRCFVHLANTLTWVASKILCAHTLSIIFPQFYDFDYFAFCGASTYGCIRQDFLLIFIFGNLRYANVSSKVWRYIMEKRIIYIVLKYNICRGI